jgi:uncharacterized repeat protein (TIGR01451 family)|tara:strand:- start:74 stop:565 length:492 start_codon:yes stop_codon:yes gene_type:complete
MMMKKILLVITTFVFATSLASAQGDSPVSFANIAQKQVISVSQNGAETTSFTDVGIVVPGDSIVYTSTFTNISSEVVSSIVVNNPVPDNTKYVRFTAQGENTTVTFSIDSGNAFSAPAGLTVTEANGVARAAKPEEYTDIRWIYQGELLPGQSSSVNFKVTIL